MKKVAGMLLLLGAAAFILLSGQKKKSPDFFAAFEKALRDHNIPVRKTTEMSAHLLHADYGKKYVTDAGAAELYSFPDDDPALKKARSIGLFSADGENFFKVSVNRNVMMHTDSPILEEIFLNIEKEG